MAPLEIFTSSSSVKGLSSVTTLVVGATSALVFDPPFLVPDGEAVVAWIKRTTRVPIKGVFVTHHHPDHFFAANAVLDAFPEAKLFAAPYVRDGIDREYEEKVVFWPTVFGKENIYAEPRKPEPFPYSFIRLEGNPESPIFLLGPLQGDSVDHTLFWLPQEKTLIAGDAVYARSTHVWVEEVETPQLLEAWERTLDVIEALAPTKLIAGHLEAGWSLDAKADLAHTRDYLKLFRKEITNAPRKPSIDELFETFKNAFPQAKENLDFFLGHLSNQFGEGGKTWEENKHHNVTARTREGLLGFCIH